MYHTTIAALCGMHLVDITVTAVGAVAVIEVTIEVCALPLLYNVQKQASKCAAWRAAHCTNHAKHVPHVPTMCRTAE